MDPYLDPRPAGAPPALVVGTMNFGKRTPEPEAARIVARALERGLVFFDTANVYNDGESERILGRALGARRQDARIATKMGIGKLSAPEGLAPARVLAAIDDSLQRLNTDHVDLYYFHKPDHTRPIEPAIRAMESLIDHGKVRAWGVSNFASWQILEILQLSRIKPRVSQLIFNLLVRQLELEYFRFAARFQVHTTVYNPLAGGLLAGKLKSAGAVEKGSRFDGNPMYQRRYLTDRFFELAEAFGELAREAGRTPAALAYQWAAAHPGVDSILLGPASVEQLDAALDAIATPLPNDVRKRADDLYLGYAGTDASYAR